MPQQQIFWFSNFFTKLAVHLSFLTTFRNFSTSPALHLAFTAYVLTIESILPIRDRFLIVVGVVLAPVAGAGVVVAVVLSLATVFVTSTGPSSPATAVVLLSFSGPPLSSTFSALRL